MGTAGCTSSRRKGTDANTLIRQMQTHACHGASVRSGPAPCMMPARRSFEADSITASVAIVMITAHAMTPAATSSP